ncbi:NAD(P)-binding protein [Decorospora gaudefroyi]|uniref:NAD(P)-binding protein n=1 Tax=Decorospora gaudefroyi TaxID=184978 RepID=A0A6A5JZD0_9PLEO|nr:NAD(P)-binding protein [Decorospora gaudefroyi]
MVKIAIAGGTGGVAQEIIDVLVATERHQILILTRREVPTKTPETGIAWVKTTYSDVEKLVGILQDVEVVLSFISPYLDQEEATTVQKNLIDASIKAGVKRFAPSEWASAGLEHLSWYVYKGATRRYLEDINKEKPVLEYSLFQPGLFTNYLTRPYESAKHVKAIDIPFDFEKRRALLRDGGDDDCISFTTVQDLASVVARAIEFEGKWPVVGGMRGTTMSVGRMIDLGEEIRGGPFTVDKISTLGLENGTWTSSWLPKADHPSISVPPEQVERTSKIIVGGLLLAIREKAFETGGEWNALLPDYEFTNAEEFLKKAWMGKP